MSSHADRRSVPSRPVSGQSGHSPSWIDAGNSVPSGTQMPTGSACFVVSRAGRRKEMSRASQANRPDRMSRSPSFPTLSGVTQRGAPGSSKSRRASPARWPSHFSPHTRSTRARSVSVPKRSSPAGRVTVKGCQSRATASSKRKRRAGINRTPDRARGRNPVQAGAGADRAGSPSAGATRSAA